VKKILVIGSDGQLGFDIMRAFGKQAIGLTHDHIEVRNSESVEQALKVRQALERCANEGQLASIDGDHEHAIS